MRPNWFSSALERRNFNVLTIDGVLYNTAMTFFDATILIPLFLQQFGGSPMLIGLATALRHLGYFLPQLFMVRWLPKIPRLSRFVFWSYLLFRFSFIAVIAVMLYDSSSHWVLITFFIGYALVSVGEGVIQVPWMDLFGRTISVKNHGKLFGLMQTFGAVGAFGGGLVVHHVLSYPERYPYPTNFIVIFGLAFLLLFFSTLSFLYVKDAPSRRAEGEEQKKVEEQAEESASSRPSFWEHLRHTLQRNRAFRRLLSLQMILGLHQLAMPFYILYIQKLPGIEASIIGVLVMAQVVGGIVSGLLLGAISSKWGNRVTVQVTVLLNVAVPVLVLAAGAAGNPVWVQTSVLMAFFMLGIDAGGWIGFTNYLMEISTDETRGHLVAYLNACSAPLAVLPIFSGSLINMLSYEKIFVIVLILLLVACAWAWRLPSTTIRHRRGGRAVRTDRQTNAAPQ